MKIYNEVLGNIHAPEWQEALRTAEVEYLDLDQWTAQKSRFVVAGDHGGEYAVALKRHAQLFDGDIIDYVPELKRLAVVRIQLNDVMVIDMEGMLSEPADRLIHTAVELGHAIGNQHWPAVVKGCRVYVPLTVDRKVMASVMHTHNIEGITYGFQPGQEVIPYLAPHEIRRLFGGTGPDSKTHHHDEATCHDHEHDPCESHNSAEEIIYQYAMGHEKCCH